MAEPGTPEPAPEPAAERARAGVRAWIRAVGGRTRSALRSVSPYTILAFLAASAVAPLAGAGPEALTAALDQVGDVGSNFLAPDSRTLAVSDMGGPVQLWDVTAGTLTATLHGHDDGVLGLAFSPDGHLLASSAGDKTTAVWRLDANDAVRELCVLAGLATRTDGVAAPRICPN